MPRFLFALFILLHGVVHLWYVTLSQRLVTFQPEMGWSGESWLFTDLLGDAATRSVASLLFVLATLGFAAGGAAILFQGAWWRPAVVGAAVLSSATILLFWDGSMELLVEKGLLGLLINVALLVALLVFQWPSWSF